MRNLNNFDERKLGLVVDFYEFTMGMGFYKKGLHEMRAVFDVFFRKIPEDGGYAVLAGIETVIEYVTNWGFTKEELEYLSTVGLDDDFLEYLRNIKFSGNIYSMREGSVIFPMEPILRVDAPILEACLLEAAILNMVNHQSLIATKASRVVYAAKGAGAVMEFGLRRAQGFDAGTIGARAALIGGCSSTSNVLTGMKYGAPISGTHAHLWIQAFDDELTAFRTYAEVYPDVTILLVDTYNVLKSGVPNAITVFKEMRDAGKLKKYGIRIDSGDMAYLSKKASQMLHEAGFDDPIICGSNDFDEYTISDLLSQGATFNSFGVGTKLITSYNCAAFGGVYKLSAIEKDGKIIPKIKLSEDAIKITNPGMKTVFRVTIKETGKFFADLIALAGEKFDPADGITLFDPLHPYKKTVLEPNSYTIEEILLPIILNGECVCELPELSEIQEYCKRQKNGLWDETMRLTKANPYYVDLSNQLYDLKKQMIEENGHFL